MKVITIPDLHGKSIWKNIDFSKYDKIIFVGDYTDSFPPVTDNEIFNNLCEIIEFKKSNFNKVELLYGNHDHQYAFGSMCSGYRPSMYKSLFNLFNTNKNLFQFAFQIKNFLWTHAGIIKSWYEDDFKLILNKYSSEECDLYKLSIADQINKLVNSNDGHNIIMQVGMYRGGKKSFGGPLWADKREFNDLTILQGYHQIVGHSRLEKIKTKYKIDQDTSITFTDCLDTVCEFYELEI